MAGTYAAATHRPARALASQDAAGRWRRVMCQQPESSFECTHGWFSTALNYSGQARARFTAPEGEVTGPATAHFNENGARDVVMEMRDITTGAELRYGLPQFLSGGQLDE